MKKIITKWLLISLGVGIIPVLVLGASQGGIALSPLILIFFLIVGVIGSSIHVNIYAYKKGTRQQKSKALVYLIVSSLFIGFIFYSSSQCGLNEEYAIKRVNKYVLSKPELETKYLSKAMFNREECMCTFEYSSPVKNFIIFVSEYGDLHFSPH